MTYRNEGVGSLLRPAYLLEAREQFAADHLSAAEFKAIEDRAVDEAIALQENAGLNVITDGEQRREHFYAHVMDAFEGFDRYGGRAVPFRNEKGEQYFHHPPLVVERLRPRRSICSEEWVYLRSRTSRPAKMTMASAMLFGTSYIPEKSKGAYPTLEAYVADLVQYSRQEVQELMRLGCTYIQLDGPNYTRFLNSPMREQMRQRGEDPDKMLSQTIEADNAIIDGHPGVTFALHICRGNNQSMFIGSGDYGPIAQVFRESHAQRFLLEYDDERSGGFEVLRHVPEDRYVVLGLVTTKKGQLEDAGELRRRIEEAAQYFPLEHMTLSPQCGFASSMEGNHLSIEDERRKLELVVRVSREVWGSA